MAYYRTLQNGERRLIFTARDRQKQRERRDRRYPLPVPEWCAVRHEPGDEMFYATSSWTRRDVEIYWSWHGFDRDLMLYDIEKDRLTVANMTRRNLLTLKRERGRITNREAWSSQVLISLGGVAVPVQASAGYLAYDRLRLVYLQAQLRNKEMALRLFDQRGGLCYLGG